MKAYKYQGAGNDFIIFDNRNGDIILNEEQIRTLCDRRYGIGADGLMLLNSNDCEDRDFKMVFYNSDGAPGTMCGNGARCLVAFAARMGYTSFRFDALDGYHTASMIEYTPFKCIVKLKIKDVEMPVKYSDTSYYVNTGVDHLVIFTDHLDQYDVDTNGRYWRHHPDFPNGTNVNFVQIDKDGLYVRTFERGVEAETYACGTGVTASAIASFIDNRHCYTLSGEGKIKYEIRTLKDHLSVEFSPNLTDVYLTGPATFVFETEIEL